MNVIVRLPAALRELARGDRTVDLELDEPATVSSLLDAMARTLPAVERRIRDETGAQRRHVNLFVGEVNIRDGRGLAEPLTDGAQVYVIPAVSGGSSPDRRALAVGVTVFGYEPSDPGPTST